MLLIVESIPYLAFAGAALLIGYVAWDLLRGRKNATAPSVALPGDSGLVSTPVALPKSVTAASARLEVAAMEKDRAKREAAVSALLEKTMAVDVSADDKIKAASDTAEASDEDSTQEAPEETETQESESAPQPAFESTTDADEKTEEITEEQVPVSQATDLSEKQEIIREEVRVFDTALESS
ncbi:MAG: hypothetical protein ACYTDT_03230 [Planctomycetota bacterium]